uniref:Rubicon Homology domain-containing protein n=1 Tax=Timema bartmani TaxID=61472 RepID=A0A7R9HWG9_9NEOP|nr:unnamed protein product [Timema bartmani]
MINGDLCQQEYQQLLQSLKGTVEGLLISHVSNVWNIYGGLNRLHKAMEKIFKHGCRVFNHDGEPDCLVFIQGLNWLQPSLAVSPTSLIETDLPQHVEMNDKALVWLYKRQVSIVILEGHTLSQKLSWLLSDREHLLSCFEKYAFLCQEHYGEATLICLRAVEQNQPSLLTEINPCLYLSTWKYKAFQKTHRRCSSFPDAQYNSWRATRLKRETLIRQPLDDAHLFFPVDKCPEQQFEESIALKSSNKHIQQEIVLTCDIIEPQCKVQDTQSVQLSVPSENNNTAMNMRLKAWTSLPNLVHCDNSNDNKEIDLPMPMKTLQREGSVVSMKTLLPSSRTVPSSPAKFLQPPCVRPSELKLSSTTWDEKDEGGSLPRYESDSNLMHKKKKTVVVGSAPEYAREWLLDGTVFGHKERHFAQKKSFIDSGGSTVLPMATGFFPRPAQGQSLTSFLSSGDFSRPSAELDRENAHFSISEAMIAAIEQVKCNRQLHLAEEVAEAGDESDEEINHLKQRIRLRRHQRQEEKQRHVWGITLLSDGRTDTTTTDQSVSPLSTSPGTPSDSISTDDVDDLEVDEVNNLVQLKNSGLSVSMASLYSEADLSKHHTPRCVKDVGITDSIVSAEGVALCLIRQFSEKHLPRASDLQWLVSEQDAPQQLLPLPSSWPISPDEAEDADMTHATPLRGTVEWAPPRPQVIFTLHPAPVRRVLMTKQNYRCAGCGMKVAPEYAHRFRYCEYLGRYFCTGCHTNQLALIPGKILFKWDFTRYPVSSFSYRLLDQMLCDPLFRIADLNVGLYRKARQLERTHQLRLQLFYLKDFVLTCRFADKLHECVQKEPPYLMMELDLYSIQDLVQVKMGDLPTRLRELVVASSLHVDNCSARGFVCEMCRSREVIFPWQLGRVARCPNCGACFHMSCWSPSPCPRCIRLNARRKSQEETALACIED